MPLADTCSSPHQVKKGSLTIDKIRHYFLNQPQVYDVSSEELRIGKDGRGKIEIIDLMPRDMFRVTIYDDSPESARESYDHINQAIEWCLGSDVFSTYRRLFDPDLRVLTVIPSSEQDLSQLYALAMVYFNILGDEQCIKLESELQSIRATLRNHINLHISALR